MNSVYQVVYNKARRALMVVNEATSCVQAKGTKTVSTAAAAAAAAIVAGLSGTAAAADAPHTTITIDGSTTAEALADIQGTAAFEGFTSVTDKDAYKSGAVYINHNNDAVVFRDGVKFVNNTSEQAGGALELQFGKASLKDAVITGNKADTWGGAIRMAGDSALTLEVSKDTLYSGNRSNVNGKLPYADMGDFAYLNGTSTGKTVLNLKAGKDATLTIADSIASVGINNMINVDGKVNITGSMEAYTGDITVASGGELTLAGGFGSYDLWSIANKRGYNSLAQSTLTVEDGGKAELGDLLITRQAPSRLDEDKKPIGSQAGSQIFVESGGELIANSITVTSQTYERDGYQFTSHGQGEVQNRGGELTVKDHITVDAGAMLQITGDIAVGRILVSAGTEDQFPGSLYHQHGQLLLNRGTSVNKGALVADTLVLDAGSRLETSSNFDSNDAVNGFFFANAIHVAEGATLAFTDFNSNVEASRSGEDAGADAVNDQVLVFADLELNGGSLNGLKNLMIGEAHLDNGTAEGSLTILKGDYAFDNLTIAKAGDYNHSNNELELFSGSLTVKSLHLEGDVEQYEGKVALTETLRLESDARWHMEGGTLVFDKGLSIENINPPEDNPYNKQIVVGAGELQAWNSQIFNVTDDGSVNYGSLTLAGSQIRTGDDGFITILDDVTLTTQQIETAVTAFGGSNLAFQNLTVKTEADEKLVFDQKYGTALIGHAVEAPASTNGTVALSIDDNKSVGVGALKVDAGTTSVAAAQGHLILGGLGGNVIQGVDAVDTLSAAALTLGKTQESKGVVNAATLDADELSVYGDFTARKVLAQTARIHGVLSADSLDVTKGTDGFADLSGTLALTGNAGDSPELSGPIYVTGKGLLTTNLKAAQAYAADYADEPASILYVDRQLKLAEGTIISVGDNPSLNRSLLRDGDPSAGTSVELYDGSMTAIDASAFLQTEADAAGADLSVFGEGSSIALEGGEMEIVNVTKLGRLDLGGSVTGTPDIDTDSLYVVVEGARIDADGTVNLVYNDGVAADPIVDSRLKAAFTKGVGAREAAILDGLEKLDFIRYDEATDKFSFNDLGNKALKQAASGNATAGVLNVAYDANAQVTDAIVRHQLSEHAGMGVWADVFYAKNEAKKLYGDFGYSADIYGGVLGFDYTAACGGTLGAALTVGTADADSEGGVLSNSLSSDFVGFSVYASKDFSGLNVKADLGYIDFSNDFSGLGDASDASTITFGVRGDFTAYQNGAFSIAPHFGLRYTRIDTDAVAFNDEQTMNVLEAPVGVKFAGTFEATGWKLVPSYDFTIVPQLGDKDVEAFGTAGDVTILSGGLFNNVLGVEAVKGNMSFGLNASYGFGPDDRANTQVNASFGYRF